MNSGTCFRTPDRVLARWRDEFGLDGLTPTSSLRTSSASRRRSTSSPVPPELAGAQRAVAKRGAERARLVGRLTTLVNSGTCFRTPDHVLARWRDEFGLEDLTPEALAPHFARVEETLNVVPVPPELAGANAHVAKRGADALGWSGDFVRRNVRGCVGSGVCAYGCPANAKQHVGVAYIPKAHAAGATTYTGVTARAASGAASRRATTGGGRLRVDAPTSSSPPAPSTRPPCSPATGSAARSSAATSPSTPPPPCGR